jgi:hypothetical protein
MFKDNPQVAAFVALVTTATKSSREGPEDCGWGRDESPDNRAGHCFCSLQMMAYLVMGPLDVPASLRVTGLQYVMDKLSLTLGSCYKALKESPQFLTWDKQRHGTLAHTLKTKGHLLYGTVEEMQASTSFSRQEKALSLAVMAVLNTAIPDRPAPDDDVDIPWVLDKSQLPRYLRSSLALTNGVPQDGSGKAAASLDGSGKGRKVGASQDAGGTKRKKGTGASSGRSDESFTEELSSDEEEGDDEEGDSRSTVVRVLSAEVRRLSIEWYDDVFFNSSLEDYLKVNTATALDSRNYASLVNCYEFCCATTNEDFLDGLAPGTAHFVFLKWTCLTGQLDTAIEGLFDEGAEDDGTKYDSFGYDEVSGLYSFGHVALDNCGPDEVDHVRRQVNTVYRLLRLIFGQRVMSIPKDDARLQPRFSNELMTKQNGESVSITTFYQDFVKKALVLPEAVAEVLVESSSSDTADKEFFAAHGRFGGVPGFADRRGVLLGKQVPNAKEYCDLPYLSLSFVDAHGGASSEDFETLYKKSSVAWGNMDNIHFDGNDGDIPPFGGPLSKQGLSLKKQKVEDAAALPLWQAHYAVWGPKYNLRLHNFRQYCKGTLEKDINWTSKTWGYQEKKAV